MPAKQRPTKPELLEQSSRLFGGIQVISQIRSNQIVRFRGKNQLVENYFTSFPGTEQTIKVRGGDQIKVNVGSARLHLQAHVKKRFVIALINPANKHTKIK